MNLSGKICVKRGAAKTNNKRSGPQARDGFFAEGIEFLGRINVGDDLNLIKRRPQGMACSVVDSRQDKCVFYRLAIGLMQAIVKTKRWPTLWGNGDIKRRKYFILGEEKY